MTIAVLLAATGLAAFGLGWLILTITRADQAAVAQAWLGLEDSERRIDDGWDEWLAAQPTATPTFRQLYDQVEVEDMHEWFAMEFDGER